MKQVKRKLTLIRSSQNLKKFGFYESPSTVGIDSIHWNISRLWVAAV